MLREEPNLHKSTDSHEGIGGEHGEHSELTSKGASGMGMPSSSIVGGGDPTKGGGTNKRTGEKKFKRLPLR